MVHMKRVAVKVVVDNFFYLEYSPRRDKIVIAQKQFFSGISGIIGAVM